jgi:biotin-(acetyl-CoA carboxylase) ligase
MLYSCYRYVNSLSVFKALLDLGMDKRQLKMKWPNDIYGATESGMKKMGGVLCETEKFTIGNKPALALYSGIGINFDNSPEGFCSIREVANKQIKKADFLNKFFTYVPEYLAGNEMTPPMILTDKGKQHIGKEVTEYWMHSGQMVDVVSEQSDKFKAQIVGISPTGHLEVKTESKVFEVSCSINKFRSTLKRILSI